MKINWKYALGEISIVVISILLAFSLNNWKENRNDKSQKRQYIENLIIDVEQEIKQLNEKQNKVETRIQNIRTIIPFLGTNALNRDTIGIKLFMAAASIDFNPENTTYQTLINSGDMKLIDDFNLRRDIEEHYAFHKTVLKNYERVERINAKYLGDFFIYHLDFEKISKGNYDFLDNLLLRNILNSLATSYSMVFEVNKVCLESNKELLEKLKEV